MNSIHEKNHKLIIPRHIGIIMDGNGRWAEARDLPRVIGHQAGVKTARQTIRDCIRLGIQHLTLYTFSTENWGRPDDEVKHLMLLVKQYADHELPELIHYGVRVQLMGNREGIPPDVLSSINQVITKTQENSKLTLNMAFNYGGRDEIVNACKKILSDLNPDHRQISVNEEMIHSCLYCPDCPDVDLVIRTGGEWRTSNFLLWQAAHAVFISQPEYWPDFQLTHLLDALRQYSRQIRRKQFIQ